MLLEVKNLNVRKVSYLSGNFNFDEEYEEKLNDDIKYINENELGWDSVIKYKIIVELFSFRDKEYIFIKYKIDFNNFKSKLEVYSFNIEIDIGG